ncbi:MAG: baseplate J/gp47 family protein [Anaerolineae bacterium]|nr:baseplate J/gp47 family protein [Anaerolineae bacterium]
MKPTLHVLRLEPHDDVVSIRDRLTFVRSTHVLLVWPDDGAIFPRRKLDLLLVQRQAQQLAMRLALVTTDPAVLEYAGDLHLSVFPTVDAARRSRWKKPRSKVFTARAQDPTLQIERAEHVAWLAERAAVRSRRSSRLGRWLVFGIVLAALGAAFWLVAPSATVTLTPAADQIAVTVGITADPALTDIDIETARMPATVISLEATSRVTIEASGRADAGATRAEGRARLTNRSGGPVIVPAGTIVATGATFPIRFETLSELILPAGDAAASDVSIRALAEHAGTQGNVPSGAITRIEGDLAGILTVTNPNATTGGTFQELKVVTADDHSRLLVLGRQQVLQRARDLLLHQYSGEQFLVPGSITIIEERPGWTTYSAVVGENVDSVSLDLRARVQAVIVDERLARQVAYAALRPRIRPGLEIAPGALTFTRGAIQQIEPDGTVTFLMDVRGSSTVAINPDAVRDRVAGTSVAEARRRLERELVLEPDHPPQIDVWPGLFGRMPALPMRIRVEIVQP